MNTASLVVRTVIVMLLCAASLATTATAQPKIEPSVDKWVTATGMAPGTDPTAQDEAVSDALRKAVEQACGTFLTAESKSQDFKVVYDKIFADTVGFVREHKIKRVWVKDEITNAEVSARVSTQQFEKDWAVIAHTVNQENNPRVIIAITDEDYADTNLAEKTLIAGVVQGKLEDFFLSKGLQLVDKGTATEVNKRDIVLAGLKDDIQELAALGARFKADVVVFGQASAKQGAQITIAGQAAHKFTATLNVRAVRTDSAQLMVSKTFGPVNVTSLQTYGGHEKAIAQLSEESAPEILKAVVEAWRKQVNVTRNIRLEITGLDYETWKTFRDEAEKLRGMKALRLREITEGVANIDVEYEFETQTLADRVGEMKDTKLTVTEFNPNRLKLKVAE